MSVSSFWAIISASLGLQPCSASDSSVVLGHAYEPSAVVAARASTPNVPPKYCEHHSGNYGGRDGSELADTISVGYRFPNGDTFAVKKLRFSNDMPTMPSVVQKDSRFENLRVAKRRADYWQLTYQNPTNDESRQKTLATGKVDVVDAGFNITIKQEFDSLLRGEKRRFSFLSLAHLRSINLQVDRRSISHCIDSSWGIDSGRLAKMEKDLACFWVEPQSTFLRWVSSPLKLTYDISSRELLIFEGVVNLLDENKNTDKAVIFYQYPEQQLSDESEPVEIETDVQTVSG